MKKLIEFLFPVKGLARFIDRIVDSLVLFVSFTFIATLVLLAFFMVGIIHGLVLTLLVTWFMGKLFQGGPVE